MEKPVMGTWPGSMNRYVFCVVFLVLSIFPAAPEGFRNITSFTFNYYFDESYRLDSQDVLLIRVLPGFSVKIGADRVDSADWYAHVISLGPVINLTDTFYMDAVYGLGFNSLGQFSHKFDANLTQETETLVISFGARGFFFPENDYYYILPSMSGTIYPVDKVRLFCKIFFSWDSDNKMTGAVWGETAYSFTALFTAHIGFTVSYAGSLGYSAIAGCMFNFSENFTMKYFFQYLGNIIEYQDAPDEKSGIANGIIVDLRF